MLGEWYVWKAAAHEDLGQVSYMTTGESYSRVLKTNGGVRCGLFSGDLFTCALKVDDTVQCCGDSTDGKKCSTI